MADELAEMHAATAAVHVPGPMRMVGRRPAPRACLGCGDPWPCERSWQARAERAEARLEHAEAALTGGNEGIRLWMLDCGELVAKHRARAEAAEAKLAEVRSVLLEGGQDHATARRRALAIIGSEEEGTPDADA